MKKIYLQGTRLCGILLLLFYNISYGQLSPTSIITGQLVSVSPELRSLPTKFAVSKSNNREFNEEEDVNRRVKFPVKNANAVSSDAALQKITPLRNAPQLEVPIGSTFDGNGQADNNALGFGNLTPPDPTISVGPNHVVQMINISHSVFNKAGTRLSGPTKFSSIATGASDSGDPIVLYDYIADRWLLMQFDLPSGNESLIFCISKTNDPAGAYNVYKFLTPGVFPDYPHIGIWNGSYVITTHEFNLARAAYVGQGFYAVDRNKMLNGQPTSTLIRFQSPTEGGYLPTSQEGNKLPEASSPASFFSYDADEFGGTDQLICRNMTVNFANPAASTLSAVITFPTAAFDGRSPTASRSAVDQFNTTRGLDAIADRMMSRVLYRRFDTYEAMVMNYPVNISGVNPTDQASYQAAMRWYELRRPTPASAWTIYQQSTYAPTAVDGANGIDRWMGSIGIDQRGSVAIAYSASSTTLYPGLYYAQHYVTDANSVMGAEQTMFAGSGSQTSTSYRWGDYSSMTTDPINGDSLWFTSEYYAATATSNFKTRIASFKINPPAANPEVHFKTSGTITKPYEATTILPTSSCLRYKDYPIDVTVDNAPSQPLNLSFSVTGNAIQGQDYDLIYPNPFILDATTLTRSLTFRVYDNAQNDPDQLLKLSYTINANGGNAVAATFNQTQNVAIASKPVDSTTYTSTTYGAPVTVFADNFDAVTTGLGAWTEQQVSLIGTNTNHFKIGANGGAGFTNNALFISNNNDAIQYSNTSGTGSVVVLRAISPSINIIGKGQLNVSFTYKCNGQALNDYASLVYSKDGGISWATAVNTISGQTTATIKTVNLPLDVQDINNLKLGIQWTCNNNTVGQPPIGIDDLVVTAAPVFINAGIQQTTNTAIAGTFNFGPSQKVYFTDGVSQKIMATIVNNSTLNYGCTKVAVDRAGINAIAFNTITPAEFIAAKTFKVEPEINAAGSYTIRLFYTEAEIAGWESATGLPRTQLKMVKVNSPNAVSTVTPANQSTITYSIVPATLGTFGTDGIVVEATFPNGGFSGFGIGAPKAQVVLPVTLLSFKGANTASGNQLDWAVTNQVEVKAYEIESSVDGLFYRTIGSVPSKTGSGNIKYNYLDKLYSKGVNYYRLKMMDVDGKFTYSNIVVINITDDGHSIAAYPNPVTNKLFVNYKGSSKTIHIQVFDAAGRTIYETNKAVERPLSLPVQSLVPGTYTLTVSDDKGKFSSIFIKN